MSEKWRDYYDEKELKALQQIEIENLAVFAEFCKMHDLEFFLYGGTLLGAEKYQGMIPWDDDIDIAMPRDSYEAFNALAQQGLPEGWFIQTPYNCPKTPFPYTKMRREGTEYLEYTYRNLGLKNGVYIDIYPVDKIPDDEGQRKRQFRLVRRWIKIFVFRQAPLYDNPLTGKHKYLKQVARYVVCTIAKVLPAEYCVKKYERYMKMYNGTQANRYAALNSPLYDNIYLNLYPFASVAFEGMMLPAPGDRKTHLQMRYGDYTKDLPEEKRFGHAPYRLNLGDYLENGEGGWQK